LNITSNYGNVLIFRVHPERLHSQGLPDELIEGIIWKQRYHSIVDGQHHLHQNGNRIIYCCLHFSKDEQRKRFLARTDAPDNDWKFSLADIEVR
jgi:polyphosphate kinase 2 (PPK2 family)